MSSTETSGLFFSDLIKRNIWLQIFLGIFIAWSGGFILIWFYNQPWFMNFFGLRDVFHIGTTNMSVAIWVGFLALF